MTRQDENRSTEGAPVQKPLELLSGIRIVAFTQFLLGPAAAQYLADMGADVIKVEEPTAGPHERRWAGAESFVNGVSSFFMLAHRNVRSIGIDLKSEDGREIARRLCLDADVVLVNFRPGVMERLGLEYEELSRENPGLIYACASGYGSDSPHRSLPGQDLLLQATSGLAGVTGPSTGPPVAAGAAVVDQHAASLLAMGILGALHARGKSGQGQRLEVTMVEAALDLQSEPLVYHMNGATVQRPSVPLASSFHEAPYGFYPVQDGHVVLSLSPMKLISEVLGDPEALQPFLSPSAAFEHREEIYEALSPLLTAFTKSELLERFRERGIWCAPVNSYDEALADEAVAYLEPVQELDHPTAGNVKVLRHPIRFGSGQAGVRRMPPELGEHTDEVLQEVGYQKDEISMLRESGAV
jgi:crotonobetainyl-CoA:carnitine CoA-transferase CaiB-like acyl-CoA transferase